MTLRQVVGLIRVIRKNEQTDFYNEMLVHSVMYQIKIPSISEFFGASLLEDDTTHAFTEDVDQALEKEAVKRLEERRKSLGK